MAKKQKKALVAYLSIPGTVDIAARKLAKVTGARLFEIQPDPPYQPEDFDRNNHSARTRWESKEQSSRPPIKNRLYYMDEYSVIYLGYNLWWYGTPRIIQSFLEEYNFTGKIIVPFTTRSSPGADQLPAIAAAMAEAYPIPTWLELRVLEDDPSEKMLQAWVDGLPLRMKSKPRSQEGSV